MKTLKFQSLIFALIGWPLMLIAFIAVAWALFNVLTLIVWPALVQLTDLLTLIRWF